MDPIHVGIISFVGVLFVLALGIHIGFALGLVGMIGLAILSSWSAASHCIILKSYSMTANYVLTAIPMFVLMGYFVFAGGVAQELFAAARTWFSRLPGALATSTVMACAGLGAACGSSLAAAATMAKIAVPEMEKYGYDRKLAYGAVASAGPLASLIPPSILIVVYGIITETSIGKVLIAGIIPGIVSALIYSLMITARATINPRLGPVVPGVKWRERFLSLKGLVGMIALFLLVMGGIYTGWFTPTEAGAAGAFGAFLIALIKRARLPQIREAVIESVRTTASIYLIIIGVNVFNIFLGYTGLPSKLAELLVGLPVSPYVTVALISLFCIFLGCFMDPLGVMVLSLPITFPVITGLGFDPIWFGVVVIILLEMGLITPPVGLTVFIVKSAVPGGAKLEEVFLGCAWFFAMMVVVLVLLVAFPQIALWLPLMMR